MRILITGATGFIGRHLLRALKSSDHICCALTRSAGIKIDGADEYVFLNLSHTRDLEKLPTGFDAVVHLGDGLSALEQYGNADVKDEIKKRIEPTVRFAEWAARAGIKHFIYVSSVKAMCGESEKHILTENSKAQPNSAYGMAKYHAECALKDVFAKSNARLIILRNPIVHGPGCTSNIRKLLRLADSPWPLPLKRLESYRSTVSVYNFCDAIKATLEKTDAPGGTYLIADDSPMSVGEIIKVFREVLGREKRLFQVPGWCWSIARGFPGVRMFAKRLNGPLVISDENFRENFGWLPLQTTRQSLQDMAQVYAQQEKSGVARS